MISSTSAGVMPRRRFQLLLWIEPRIGPGSMQAVSNIVVTSRIGGIKTRFENMRFIGKISKDDDKLNS
jgi:hypothetical protein